MNFYGLDINDYFVYKDNDEFVFLNAYGDIGPAFQEVYENLPDGDLVYLANEYDCAPCRLLDLPSGDKECYIDFIAFDQNDYPIYFVEQYTMRKEYVDESKITCMSFNDAVDKIL